MKSVSLCAILAVTVACHGGVTEPTTAGSTRSSLSERLAAGLSAISLAGPAPGCQPATERVEWVVTVSSAPELIRLYPSAFRDPKAGCQPTTHSLALMTVDGPSHYFTGQSGQTRFIYEAGRATCGRVAVGRRTGAADTEHEPQREAAGHQSRFAVRLSEVGRPFRLRSRCNCASCGETTEARSAKVVQGRLVIVT